MDGGRDDYTRDTGTKEHAILIKGSNVCETDYDLFISCKYLYALVLVFFFHANASTILQCLAHTKRLCSLFFFNLTQHS